MTITIKIAVNPQNIVLELRKGESSQSPDLELIETQQAGLLMLESPKTT